MKKILDITLIVTLTFVLFVMFVNLPAKYFSSSYWFPSEAFGTVALTDISSGDTLSAFPTVQNANNTILENVLNSIIGTTTISTLTGIGTITTGTWSADAIAVNKGGTGTTSPSVWMVMLGNGANGLTMASSTGTTGQFLTSNGAGAYPSWQTASVNQTTDYNFTSSAFRVKNLHASSTAANPITLNGLSYSTPSIRAASSTVLSEDGSGNLLFITPASLMNSIVSGINVSTGATATTTLYTVAIPANTLTTTKQMRITGIWGFPIAGGSACYAQIDFGDGSATTTLGYVAYGVEKGEGAQMDVVMFATSTTAQIASTKGSPLATTITTMGGLLNLNYRSFPSANLAATTYIAFRALAIAGTETCSFDSESVEILSK